MIAMRGRSTQGACDHGWVRRLLTIALVFGLVGSACRDSGQAEPSGNPVARATFSTHQEAVRTDALSVADSPEERRVGLMGVEALDEDGGMVFVFDGEQDGSFWMKDTLIPLSIAFWGADGRLLDILEMEPCTADPCPTYSARAPYTHALEMNAHWFDDRGIEIGDRVELTIDSE
jgi:uncharacterized membrane protein (UPF0127 family)